MLVEWHVIGTCCMQCDSSCMIDSVILRCVCRAPHASTQDIWVWHFDARTDMQRSVRSSSSIAYRTSVDWIYSYASMYSRLHAVNWYCETTAQQQPWFASLCTRSNVSTHAHYTLTRLFDYSYQTHNVHDILFRMLLFELNCCSTHWLPTLLSNRVALFISPRWDVKMHCLRKHQWQNDKQSISCLCIKR